MKTFSYKGNTYAKLRCCKVKGRYQAYHYIAWLLWAIGAADKPKRPWDLGVIYKGPLDSVDQGIYVRKASDFYDKFKQVIV